MEGRHSVAQLDYLLLSPALSAATEGAAPTIERRGIGFKNPLKAGGYGPRHTWFKDAEDDPDPVRLDFGWPRFEGVSHQTLASDHCPLFIEIPKAHELPRCRAALVSPRPTLGPRLSAPESDRLKVGESLTHPVLKPAGRSSLPLDGSIPSPLRGRSACTVRFFGGQAE